MKFAIFGSVDIRPLPGAWVAELLGVVLGVQDRYKVKFPSEIFARMALKGLIFACNFNPRRLHIVPPTSPLDIFQTA